MKLPVGWKTGESLAPKITKKSMHTCKSIVFDKERLKELSYLICQDFYHYLIVNGSLKKY